MLTLLQKSISDGLKQHRDFARFHDALKLQQFPLALHGVQQSFFAFVVGRLVQHSKQPFLLVLPTEQEAEQLMRDLATAGVSALFFPWWGVVPYRPLPANSPVFGERSQALQMMLDGNVKVVVTTVRAFTGRLVPPDAFRAATVRFAVGQRFQPQAVAHMLEAMGYLRVAKAGIHGEFALRGEVLDIAMFGAEDSLRIVFDFEVIGQIRVFDPDTQQSQGTKKAAVVYPVREFVWSDARRAALHAVLSELPELQKNADALFEELVDRGRLPREEMLYPLLFDRVAALPDYLPADTRVFFLEYERLIGAADAVRKEYEAMWRKLRHTEPVLRPERALLDFEELAYRTECAVVMPLLKTAEPLHVGRDPAGSVRTPVLTCSIPSEGARSFFGNVQFLREELTAMTAAGTRIWVFADSAAQATRIGQLLRDLPQVNVIAEGISGGFSVPQLRIAAIAESEIFGRRRRTPQSVRTTKSEVIDTFVELNPGDHVVHVNYGIGRFLGIERVVAAGNERDYIRLEYADQEFVFIPIEQVNLVQRYIGSQGNDPRLDKLGGKSWESRKSRVKKHVEDLAERLIDLYARRKMIQGFAFPADAEWQTEFEATFPFEETADQIQCIDDVKHDMEQPVPMDRLVCGDVGFGKTEVAIRAVFKAVTAGKQAAILAPTTILVEQHYENLEERLQGFPVKAAMLSRFVAPKDQKKVLAGLSDGSVDLVIGTHRLLQKDVQFHDLGLIVVDEEQRFGVKDKERLKELKHSVDCLTLTATPIPRTLHMSLLHLRDMSVLKTPPTNRRPIETVIEPYSAEIVTAAIRREIERGGQVFYLHNRVETLEQTKLFVQALVPEVIVDTAHGKMNAVELEDVMHRFIHQGSHVLVATTIIENGIDIPNVNTIIIDRADIYGISQLYQLRGRVGRSERLAYAYMLYPDQRALSEIAMKRLQIISDFTELGSGFKVAMKDLEVRGAGNLLGSEQSGDIVSVGFDLYVRLLDEAIQRRQSQTTETAPEPYLDLDYAGFIPDAYIQEPMEKMEVYKKIASVSTDDQLDAVSAGLEDRFGPFPDEVASLLSLAEIRIICKKLYISSLKERHGRIEARFEKLALISIDRLVHLVKTSAGRVRLDPKQPNVLVMTVGAVGLKEKSEFIRGRLSGLL